MIREDQLILNYKLLSIEILSKALDDICPKYIEDDPKADILLKAAAKECERVCGEIHKGQVLLIAQNFEDQWESILKNYLSKKIELEKAKSSSIANISKADNSDKIDLKLDQAASIWDKRKRTLEGRIQARRRGFTSRVEGQKGIKYTPQEVRDLKVGLEAQINREIRDFEKRREMAMQKILQSRNSYRIIERITEKEVIYDTKIKALEKSSKRQEEIYNRQWEDTDTFGAALDWFISDLPQVKFWCAVAGVPLMVCYQTVRTRLELMNHQSSELDSVVEKFRTGEYSEQTIPDLTI